MKARHIEIVFLSIFFIFVLMVCKLGFVNYTLNLIFLAHSWFISVVDSNELFPVKPLQVNQSKYENHENEGAMGP